MAITVVIKTTSRYHLISVRTAIIKKYTGDKYWGEKGILLHYWWEYKLLEPPWETVCMFLKKLKIRVAI